MSLRVNVSTWEEKIKNPHSTNTAPTYLRQRYHIRVKIWPINCIKRYGPLLCTTSTDIFLIIKCVLKDKTQRNYSILNLTRWIFLFLFFKSCPGFMSVGYFIVPDGSQLWPHYYYYQSLLFRILPVFQITYLYRNTAIPITTASNINNSNPSDIAALLALLKALRLPGIQF